LEVNIELDARCKTTAMGIMPHTDIEKALRLSLSLDIPFWPQLPTINFYEDMYAQLSQNFPGIAIDPDGKGISFDTAGFEQELVGYAQKMDEPEIFTISRDYSVVYHKFLAKELEGYHAIRGQITGPVSFGFKVLDEGNKPIIYNEGARTILYDFIQRKANIQYRELKERNQNAFVWLDEPGLGWVFSGLSGYNDVQAKKDYDDFLYGLEGPKALHLCAKVNLPYLLGLGIELLSFDSYQLEFMPKGYTSAVAEFLGSGGVISWGIVPTDSSSLAKETPETLAKLLSGYWEVVSQHSGVSAKQIAEQALIAPARCCLKNIGRVGAADEVVSQSAEGSQISTIEESLVERAFAYLGMLSEILKDEFGL